jgi:hypothetical protein
MRWARPCSGALDNVRPERASVEFGLDLATGRVCGIVTTTRDAQAPRGGWAVPVRVLRELHRDVWAAHDRFHHPQAHSS